MKWAETESKFKYSGKPVTRKTAISNTPLGQFKVYESVGGRVFIVHPFIKRAGGLPNFNSGEDDFFGPPKILVESLKKGIEACEAKWIQIQKAIANT